MVDITMRLTRMPGRAALEETMMEVLITCPSQRDRKAIASLSGYHFHLLDAPLNPRTPSPELDLLEYIDRCRAYIRTHHIDAVYYSRDVADLAAAALCEEFGFPGPSIESVFLCRSEEH